MDEKLVQKKALFKRVFKSKQGQYLVRLSFTKKDKNGSWCTTTKAVYDFASKAFENNEKVLATVNKTQDSIHVTRIEKAKQNGKKKKGKTSKNTKTKNDNKKTKLNYDNGRSASIEKQVIVKAVAETVKGIQLDDEETVLDLIDKLLKKYDNYMNS